MYSFLRFIFLVALLCSCNEIKVDIPDTGRKIVINGLITDDEPLNVSISQSAYILDIDGIDALYFDQEDNIKALVYENNKRIDSLTPEKYYEYDWFKVFNKGNFKSASFYPSSGKQYRIEVSGKDFPDASVTTIIPDVVRIEQIDTSRIILPPGSFYTHNIGLLCRLVFTDPPDKENFYMVRMFIYSYFEAPHDYLNPYSRYGLLFSSNDPVIEEKLKNINGLQAVAFSDKLINGQKHYLDIVVKGEDIGEPLIHLDLLPNGYTANKKTIYIKLYSISEEFFRYIQTLQLYSRNYSNPLAEPVLMNSNVLGGFGMLSGASVSSDSIIFNKK
jgi:hypothetical protein